MSDLDDRFEEMWRIEHPLYASSNDSLGSPDEGGEQQQPKAAQVSSRMEQARGEAREATSKNSQEVAKK